MSIRELNRKQLIQLKQHHITEKNDAAGKPTYLFELTEADMLVSDEEMFNNYDDINFVPDDFE